MKTINLYKYLFVCIVLVGLALPAYPQTNADSLYAKLEAYSESGIIDKNQITIIKQIYHLQKEKNPNQAIESAAHALSIAISLNDSLEMAVIYNLLGDIHLQLNKPYPALSEYFTAYKIYIARNMNDSIPVCLIKIGNVYFMEKNYDLADTNYFKALQRFKEQRDYAHTAEAFSHIGKVRLAKDDPEDALEHFTVALEYVQNLGNKKRIAQSLIDIAPAYLALNEYKSALSSLRQALDIYMELKDEKKQAETYFYLGDAYLQRGLHNEAKENYAHALEYFKLFDNQLQISAVYNRLAQIELTERKSKQAIVFLNKALATIGYLDIDYDISISASTDNRLIEQKRESYRQLALAYEGLGNFDSANIALRKYCIYNDFLAEYIAQNQSSSLQMTIENQRFENEIMLLQREKAQSQSIQLYLIITIALSLFFMILLIYAYFEKWRHNKTLASKNIQIKENHEELTQTLDSLNIKTKELQQANTTKSKMLAIISHDLRNPLGTFKNMTQMLVDEHHNLDTETRIEIFRSLAESANQTYILLENLLYWASSQRGKISFDSQPWWLVNLVDDTFALLTNIAKDKEIELISVVDDSILVVSDKNMTLTILRNLISNAIKFTPQRGKITIDAKTVDIDNELNRWVEISVSDTGVGISTEKRNLIFNEDTTFTTKGTNNEKGSGLGLILCKEFVKRHGGRIWVEANAEQGSTFKFTLPANKKQVSFLNTIIEQSRILI